MNASCYGKHSSADLCGAERIFTHSRIQVDVSPLERAIAANNAVVFVGAGASIPARLPSWPQFLRNCLRKAQSTSPNPETWALTTDLLENQGDLLMAAELLQLGLGSQLEQFIWEDFAWAVRPSPIHQAISRIPFSLAITTNYDRLLEISYRNRPSVTTWRSPLAFFNAVKNGRFAVVKTHGDVGDGPSLVLTKTQYRDLIHLNEAFNSCLRTLLCYKSFLFVGYSLRDHDLLGLMDEARLTFGQDFGPHYAILFEDSVDHHFLRFLAQSYSIVPIVCRPPDGKRFTPEERTQAVVDVLHTIGGRVALLKQSMTPNIRLDGPLFCFPDQCAEALENALSTTGALRGEICLIRDEHFQALYSIASGYQGEVVAQKLPLADDTPIPHTGVIGSLFLRADKERRFLYLKDTDEPALYRDLKLQRFPDTKYVVCDSNVKSELACAIYADGQKIGVLNVESEVADAFSSDHLTVISGVAEQIASAYIESKQRQASSQALSHYFSTFSDFTSVMSASRFLKSMSMRFILWEVNHNLGRLVPHWDPAFPPNTRIFDGYTFNETSLAGFVARSCSRPTIDDVNSELNGPNSRISEKGVEAFDIKGPIAAMPIQCGGNLAGVLVAWSAKPEIQSPAASDARSSRAKFAIADERIFRIAHLVANEPSYLYIGRSRAKSFVERLNDDLTKIDHGLEWDLNTLKNPRFRWRIIDALLDILLDPAVGLGRLRLWRRCKAPSKTDSLDLSHFKCIASRTLSDFTARGCKQKNAYEGVFTSSIDPFCHYTVARYRDDPYARHQDWGMFRMSDVNSEELHKDPMGAWIVGPIVGRSRLYGFLSADNHKPHKNGDRIEAIDSPVSEKERSFHRAAIDVVTHMLSMAMVYDSED